MAKRRRKKSAGRYFFRRLLVLLFVIALIGAACIYAGYSIGKKNDSVANSISSESVSSTESNISSGDSSAISEASEVPKTSEPAPKSSVNNEIKEILDSWNMILVNKNNPLPDGFEVELEKVVDEFRVDVRAREPLLKMLARAKEDGVTLIVCSAYRAPDYQEVLFNNKVNELLGNGMSREQAYETTSTIIAIPGTSEHHTGLAVDIVTPAYQSLDDGFELTPAFEWLSKNAADYGFILRYPKNKEDITQIIYEPWHYRFVGEDMAKQINESGMCLEEYIADLQSVLELNELIEPEDEGEEEEE